ncbi:hypothetical protein NDU88_005370 [Pleurodeles waltl]|uniref:Secreted protein n=1 Tax=Pleurodeles waltl TaxID=8319 RepID=A0AAV7UIS4_PLEWA|nr:hypothetical protein NDU88_005370 [Pleurodeles waltl]
MSRVCAWIFLLVLRLRVDLWGWASELRSRGRRRVDFSSGCRPAGLRVGITISRQASRRFLLWMSTCGAARRNYDLAAGVASISPLDVDLRGCASEIRSRGRRRVDFSSGCRSAGLRVEVTISPERRVDQRRCAAFFLPPNKLCVEIFNARSVQRKEGSLFGPETSGNRRQALSKPLESTFTAREEFSKAAGQQQGSSPL